MKRCSPSRPGITCRSSEGDPRNLKITTPADLAIAERLLGLSRRHRQLCESATATTCIASSQGRPLILGGVTIPFDKGLLGHSDADAICHAVTDAVLGAAGAGDIGRHFPDTDPAWKDANSLDLLRQAVTIVKDAGYAVVNVDVVVIAQKPKLVPSHRRDSHEPGRRHWIATPRRSASRARRTRAWTRWARGNRSPCTRSRCCIGRV